MFAHFQKLYLMVDDMGECQQLSVKVLVLNCAVGVYLKRRVGFIQACLLCASRLDVLLSTFQVQRK